MDKQMIEEMAKVVQRNMCGDVHCEECNYNGKMKILPRYCGVYLIAKSLYNAGYRKIPELPKDTVLTNDDIAELLTIVAKDTRKETAEKFAERMREQYPPRDNVHCTLDDCYMLDKIDEICKVITEGKNAKNE